MEQSDGFVRSWHSGCIGFLSPWMFLGQIRNQTNKGNVMKFNSALRSRRIGDAVAVVGFLTVLAIAIQSTIGANPPALPDPAFAEMPGPLTDVPVPLPEDLENYVKDRAAAIVLGKAFFWDMQVGSDGKTACATCHSHAFADARTRNTLAPAKNRSQFPTFRGANQDISPNSFPFHRLANPLDRESSVSFDTTEVVGSQGVVKRVFAGVQDGRAIDKFTTPTDLGLFQVKGVAVRQVTSRQAPTTINAIFQDRNFWDGRASRFFNGVDIFGDQNPDAKVYKAVNVQEAPQPVSILLDNAAMASLAVGPPLSDVEMSWAGRTFPDVGRKMLQLRPLAKQHVDPQDSV